LPASDTSYLRLCSAADATEEAPLRVECEGSVYAVFKVGAAYFVTADACTHGPGSLSEGMVLGDEVECPFHQGRFHIPSGRPTAPPCTVPVQCWTVHVIEGQIMIDPNEIAGERMEERQRWP